MRLFEYLCVYYDARMRRHVDVKRTKTMDGEIEEERGGVGMGRGMIVPLYLYLSLFSLVFVSSRVVYCRLRKKERERESFPFHPI